MIRILQYLLFHHERVVSQSELIAECLGDDTENESVVLKNLIYRLRKIFQNQAQCDLILFKNHERLKEGWLKLHLGKMIGGYISAATAFVVVNQFFPSFYGWFIPGIIGGFVITYWTRKIKAKKSVANKTLN